MAKKVMGAASGSIFDIVSSVDKTAEVLSESKTAVIKDYIDTGSYILNAALTGSLFKGAPTGRVVTLSGEPGSGKSFLAVSICRNAQKKGYVPIYMDSEGAIDKDFVTRLGCDPTRFIIKQVTTIKEVSTFMANILQKLEEQDEESRDKVVFVLDSIGNLTSDKEMSTTLDGGSTQDLTKQREVKALFRTNTTALAKTNTLMIVCAHQYQTMDLFGGKKTGGGSGLTYNSSLTMLLSTAKLDDKESDKIMENKTGEFLKTGVVVTAKPEKSRFTIPQKVRFVIPFFKAPNPYVGLDSYLTWDNSGIMIKAKALTEKEYIKLTDAEKGKCKAFTDENGTNLYAYPKDTARTICVAGKGEFPMNKLFTKDVLTDELLHKLDETVIGPLFELPSQSSMADIDELIDEE